jgi:hypothetical protein
VSPKQRLRIRATKKENKIKIFLKQPPKQRCNVTSCFSDGYDKLPAGFALVNLNNFKKYLIFLLTYSTIVE